MLRAGNIRYELAERDRAVTCGGIGAVHLLAHHVGLPQAIDRHVRMLKRHVPYFESDHVLSLAYNILADGSCIEDLELLRTNEAVLEALGAQRLPDPTTAGDFCRRFETDDQVVRLQETINDVRLTVWRQQDRSLPMTVPALRRKLYFKPMIAAIRRKGRPDPPRKPNPRRHPDKQPQH